MITVWLPTGPLVAALLGGVTFAVLAASYPRGGGPRKDLLLALGSLAMACYGLCWLVAGNRLFIKVSELVQEVNAGVSPSHAFLHDFPEFFLMAVPLLVGLLLLAWPRRYRDPGQLPWLAGVLHGWRLPVVLGAVALAIVVALYNSPLIDSGYCVGWGARELTEGRTPYGGTDVCSPGVATFAVGVPSLVVARTLGAKGNPRVSMPSARPDPDDPFIFASGRATAALFFLISLFAVWRVASRDGVERAAAPCLAWLAFPTNAFAATLGFNDYVAVGFSLLALAYVDFPIACGVLLSIAAQAKFLPALLLPLFAAYQWRDQRLRMTAAFIVTGAVGVGAFAATGHLESYLLLAGKLTGRGLPLSLWGLVTAPGVRTVLLLALGMCVALGALALLRPGRLAFGRMVTAAGSLMAITMLLDERPHPGTLLLPVSFAVLAAFGSFPSAYGPSTSTD